MSTNTLVVVVAASTSSLLRLSSHSTLAFITILTILLHLCISSNQIQSTQPTQQFTPVRWPTTSVGGQIDNIITDERDGSIFVSSDGDIFKYSNELALITRTNSASNITSQYANKVLKIIKFLNQDVLLSCWQIRNLTLTCALFDMNQLKFASLNWYQSDRNLTFGIDANERLDVLSGGEILDNLLLMTASRPTATNEQLAQVYSLSEGSAANSNMRPPPFHMPALGRYRVTKTKRLEVTTVLPYRTQLENFNPLYDYIYMFHFEGYTYFVLNDIQRYEDPNQTRQTVRIARICKSDPELTSYTEISITCNGQVDIYAKVAYLDTSKSITEPILYIVFEKKPKDELGASNRRSPPPVSYLCSYSMKLAQDIFHKAVQDCHEGRPLSTLLSKLHGESENAPICQKNPTRDWCTSATNPYIDGYSNQSYVKDDTYLELNGLSSANFFLSASQGEVYFIGTESGLITKLGSNEELFYTIDVHDHRVENYPPEGGKLLSAFSDEIISSRRGTSYSFSKGNITATNARSEIHQLSIDSCQYYTSCHSCITNRDPLKCVWCGDTCSTRSACDDSKRSVDDCPPIIYDFMPRSGPLTGSTRLTILGDSFGTEKSQLNVLVGDQDCVLDRRSSDNHKIECLVKRVAGPTNGIISVNISDSSSYIVSLKGVATSRIPFEYRQVSVYGLHPAFGPRAGGTELRVYGENLDVGRYRTVYLGDTGCDILSFEPQSLRCRTKPLNLLASSTSSSEEIDEFIVEQPLRVLIDGIVQNLTNRSTFDGLEMSAVFQFRSDLDASPTTAPHNQPWDDGQEWHLFNMTNLLMLLLVIVLVAIVLYLARHDGIAELKQKFALASMKGELKDAAVSYRNPQSHMFMSTQPNGKPTDSLNGLIKLNDSIMSSDYFGKTEQLEQDKPLMNNFLDDEMMTILAQEKILVDRNRLTLGHVLGSGQFGRVYKGFLKVDNNGEHTAVAVKTLHNRCHWDDTTDNRAFLEEGLMMKDFNHDNVLALIGVTFDSNGLPMVITPFMLYGDLRSYISDEASSPTVKELIEFGIQVAQGMAYLSNLKFVHRDLAARNCMLDENLIVKVADFGLSRDIYERDYYSSDNKKAKLPVKWMAIESLEKSVYSTKTDVWSYGVLLWELMTRGVVPYPDVDNFDLFSYLKEGRRMLRPRYCPVSLYRIMQACWSANPMERPSFDELVERVSSVITQLQEAKDDGGQQKVSRNETYCDVIR